MLRDLEGTSPATDPLDIGDPFATDTPDQRTDDQILEDEFPDEYAARERARSAKLDRLYPKPTEQDILTLKENLDGQWQEWRTGSLGPTASANADTSAGDFQNRSGPTDGIPGLTRVRAMRYHRDDQPAKYKRYMNSSYRWRSNFTASEIDRTVALATRNPFKARIPPGSRSTEAADKADRETRWAQYLMPTLERQAMMPLFRIFCDGVFEGGFAGFEIFLTGGYDDLDLDQRDDEDDATYEERTDDLLMSASARRLPVGIRVPDPLAVLPWFDDDGLAGVMIVEDKPYLTVYNDMTKGRSAEDIEQINLPKPGTPGWPQGYDNGWGSPTGNVLTVRTYDRRWYSYMVAGKFVDGPLEHKMPGVPFIPCFGNITSSSNLAEKIQGIAWGMVEQEQVINDVISQTLDVAITYGRPKPYVETQVGGSTRDPALGPTSVKLGNPDEAPELAEGQRLKDAFEGFQNRLPQALLNVMLQIRASNGMSPVAQGESPGSDPSGFAVNTLQAAGQMRYEIYLDNISRAAGQLIDFIRAMIKEGPINDKVFVPVQNQHGEVEYLGLGPDDVTDMPAVVFIDPMNDVNRLAIRQSLIAGNQAGYIDRATVQQQGYAVDDPRLMDNLIAEDIADQQLMGLALETAKMKIGMALAPPANGTGLVDAQGRPLSSQPAAGDDNELRGLGGMPREDRGTGRVARSDGGQPQAVTSSNQANAARSRGGQAPANQGAGAQAPNGGA